MDRGRPRPAWDHPAPACHPHASRRSRGYRPMTIFTHILATTAVVQAMQLRDPKQIALAFLFGVAVDVDHAVKAPFYLRAVGLRDRRGYYWRSSLQEPVAFLWILPLSILLGSVVPIICFSIHLLMDYSVKYEKL